MTLYGAIFERMLLPMSDLIRGRRTATLLRFLLQTQYWGRAELDGLIDHKVRKLVEHAYRQVPYYRRVMDAGKITPADIRTAEDLRLLPVLDREQLQEEPDQLVSADIRVRRARWHHSSGTTGTRVRFARCTDSAVWAWAAMYRYFRWMGIDLGERRLSLWGARDFVPSFTVKEMLADWVWRRRKLPAYQITDETIDEYVSIAQQVRPAMIRGYASAVHRFALRVEELGVSIPSLRAISVTSDSLTSEMRKDIESALGAPVFDQYACKEVLGGAYECELREGLHIAEEHNVIEVEAPEGEEGDILITDLDNYAMPMLRYRNGDCGILEAEGCPCARGLRRLRRVLGRAGEFVVLSDSRRLNRSFFSPFFRRYPFVGAYQVIQDSPSRLLIKIESREGRPPELARMEVDLRDRLGSDVTLKFSLGRISPGPTGKRQLIVPYRHASE